MTKPDTPTPAASGAAPADTFRGNNAQLINCINAALSLDLDGCLAQPLGSFGRDLLSAASVRLAALASREATQPASPAPLTDEQINVMITQAVNEWADKELEGLGQPHPSIETRLVRVVEAALASPQVATAPVPEGFALVPLRLTREMERIVNEEDWQWSDLLAAAETLDEDAENWYTKADEAIEGMKIHGFAWDGAEWRENAPEVATPVQVAPAPVPIAYLKACGGLHAWMSYRTCSPDDPNAIPVYEGATPVQVAPQDDARDAARYRFLRESDGLDEQVAGLNQCHWDKVIDAAMSASTPAAKPTEERS